MDANTSQDAYPLAQPEPAARPKRRQAPPDAMPPGNGQPLVSHIHTFSGMVTTAAKTYRPSDEALRASLENARFMRNDCLIMECLEARQRGTALLNWHLEAEDPKSADQKDLCKKLTDILARTPRFTEYRRALLEAIWAGRAANQNIYGWQFKGGKKSLIVKQWKPINGDKLVFRFDDGSGQHEDGQVGIRVSAAYPRDKLVHGMKLEAVEMGMAYFLTPEKRSLLTVHRHMIEDAPFEDSQSAGSIHGVGVRSRIYWTWYQKQEAVAMLMELMERTGAGFNIWYYPAGNPEAKAQVMECAKNATQQNTMVIPRTPGDPAADGFGYDRIEPNAAGVESLKSIAHEFFGHQIKRYILGQILSSESDATGLGSGVADLHLESFLQIIHYDAQNLEETITRELLTPLKDYNFPDARDIDVHFKIDTESPETEKKLSAAYQAWQMGLEIKASDIWDILGFSKPEPGDEVLSNPQLAHLSKLSEMADMRAISGLSPEEAITKVVGAEDGEQEQAAPTADNHPLSDEHKAELLRGDLGAAA